MNQILYTNNNNNNYNKIETKKIIVIFCVALILVALAIIALKIFAFKDKKTQIEGLTPELSIIREDEESKEITIKASCEDGIDYIKYAWNDEKDNMVNLHGSSSFERIIDMPENSNNTLKVEIVSTKGVKTEKTEEYNLGIENNKPEFESIAIVDSKLQIKITDDNGISYLKYQWENEEEITITADEENNKELEVEIDIKRGTYKLVVKVFDISGNKEEISKLITGVNEPEIKVIRYGGVVRVTVSHDMGFKKIEYAINDELYVYDKEFSGYNEDETKIELEFPIKEGENIVQVTAYSMELLSNEVEDKDDITNYSSKEFIGKCTYEIEE